jgi:hypothetical protein
MNVVDVITGQSTFDVFLLSAINETTYQRNRIRRERRADGHVSTTNRLDVRRIY